MVVFIHVANVLYLGSYLVKDILWLRVLTVLGGLVLLTYYLLQPVPLWVAAGWNVLFLSINAWQIRALILSRRPVVLDPREARLYQLAFRGLTQREFKRLLGVGRWEDVGAGAAIARTGEELDRVMVLASGRARVEVKHAPVAELAPGCFVGEMSFLTGEKPNADVVATEPTVLLSWPKQRLRAALDQSLELRAAFQMVLGEDLVAKLRPA